MTIYIKDDKTKHCYTCLPCVDCEFCINAFKLLNDVGLVKSIYVDHFYYNYVIYVDGVNIDDFVGSIVSDAQTFYRRQHSIGVK